MTIFSLMLTIACRLVVGLRSDLVRGWLVVMHTFLYYFVSKSMSDTNGRTDGQTDEDTRLYVRPFVRSVSLSVVSVRGVRPMGERNRYAS